MARILYVDDETSVQRVVRLWLTRRGHEVHTAANLAEATRILETVTIDGVFVDLWLGTESGFELQAWIDEHVPQLARRVAFVTGDVTPDEPIASRLEDLGLPVLAKPFEFAAVEARVAEWGGAADGVGGEAVGG